MSEAHFIGQMAASAAHGLPLDELLTVKSASDSLGSTNFHARVAELAEGVFIAAGLGADPSRFLYGELAKKASLMPTEREFVDDFTITLADLAPELSKQASVLDSIPQAIAGGVAAGTGLGALYWGMGRGTEETNADSVKAEAQRDIYARLAAETKARTERRRRRMAELLAAKESL